MNKSSYISRSLREKFREILRKSNDGELDAGLENMADALVLAALETLFEEREITAFKEALEGIRK